MKISRANSLYSMISSSSSEPQLKLTQNPDEQNVPCSNTCSLLVALDPCYFCYFMFSSFFPAFAFAFTFFLVGSNNGNTLFSLLDPSQYPNISPYSLFLFYSPLFKEERKEKKTATDTKRKKKKEGRKNSGAIQK